MEALGQNKDQIVVKVLGIRYRVRVVIPALTDLPRLLFEFRAKLRSNLLRHERLLLSELARRNPQHVDNFVMQIELTS